MTNTALIVGAGSGTSAAFARALKAEGAQIALAARNPHKLADLSRELDAATFACDVADPADVARLFASLDPDWESPDVVLFNPSARVPGPIVDLDSEAVTQAIAVMALGGFHVAQQAAKRMLPRGHGAIFFTGASASLKGYAQSAAFAMGKFALRGLAQSLARELGPQGIHVAHFIIDGAIRVPGRADRQPAPGEAEHDTLLDPDAIAQTYLSVLKQQRSAWSFEVDLRPWVERF